MEWSKVKSILIVLLLAANIILGINIAAQVLRVRSAETESTKNACALLSEMGIEFDEELFFSMPTEMRNYNGRRSVEGEKKIATDLLGQCEIEEAGGGITKYSSNKGKAVFRSGGLFEIELYDYSGTEIELIAAAGIKSESTRDGYLMKMSNGMIVVNAKLNVKIDDGNGYLSGRWIFSESLKGTAQSVPRSELVLAVLAALDGEDSGKITSVFPVYFLQEERASDIALVPAWQVELLDKTVIINAITKKPIFF